MILARRPTYGTIILYRNDKVIGRLLRYAEGWRGRAEHLQREVSRYEDQPQSTARAAAYASFGKQAWSAVVRLGVVD